MDPKSTGRQGIVIVNIVNEKGIDDQDTAEGSEGDDEKSKKNNWMKRHLNGEVPHIHNIKGVGRDHYDQKELSWVSPGVRVRLFGIGFNDLQQKVG